MREPWKVTREMFLSVDEVYRLLMHVERQVDDAEEGGRPAFATDRVIIESLLFSGLRSSEFCRLTLADVDLSRQGPSFAVRGTPREDRVVFLPRRLGTLLKGFVAEVRPELLPAGASRRDRSLPLVPNERGRAYERTGLYRRVVRILTEAGLGSRASVQLLRHTYGYLAYLRTGGNLLFVQKQLGHAHPMVTSVYAEFVEFSKPMLADAVAVAQAARQASGSRRAQRHPL